MEKEYPGKALFDESIEIIKQRPFMLYLGAGVNEGISYRWKDLLGNLFEYAVLNYSVGRNMPRDTQISLTKYLTEDKNCDVYFKASIIKRLLGREYLPLLQKVIYQRSGNIDDFVASFSGKGAAKRSSTLWKIAELCASGHVAAVITTNYDVFLSNLINHIAGRNGTSAVDIYETRPPLYERIAPGGKTHFPVYHVHGFIPSPDSLINLKPENVVLSQDEYFNAMLQPHSWQTTVQAYYFMNFPCLFIGCSMTDWNVLRLVASARVQSEGKNTKFAVLRTARADGGDPEACGFFADMRQKIYESILFVDARLLKMLLIEALCFQ
jgi:hypothetical protein